MATKILISWKWLCIRGSQMKTEHPLQSDNRICFIQKELPGVLIDLSHWETRWSILVLKKEVGHWWIHNLTHSCNSSSIWNQHPRMSFFRSPKMWKSQGERTGLYGGCWSVSQPNLWSLSLTRLAVSGQVLSCKRMIPSYSIPGRFDFTARRRFCIALRIDCGSTL